MSPVAAPPTPGVLSHHLKARVRSGWAKRSERKVNTMNATKLAIKTDAAIPLIAALPFALAISGVETGTSFNYNPGTQLATFRGGRDFSTCREDESVSPIWNSRSDTKKDD
jgi:hypothetical protein